MNAKEYIQSIEASIGFDRGRFLELANGMGEQTIGAARTRYQAYFGKDYEFKTSYPPNEAGAYTLRRSQLILDKIREALVDTDHAQVGSILVENLPIGDFNGFATCAPNGDRIVVVDMFLKWTLMRICQDLFALLQMRNQDQLTPDSIQPRLQHILQSIRILRGNQADIDLGRYLQIGDSDDALVTNEGHILSECMMVFILAHEYAHHLLHLSSEPMDAVLKWNGKEAVLKSFASSQEREHEADELGFSFYVQCHQRERSFPVFAALCDYYFAPMLLFDLMATKAARGETNVISSTHPEPSERKRRLLAELPGDFGNENARSMYVFFSEILDLLSYVAWPVAAAK